ncbi:MAG TPA: SHOCT domain-containing protein [Burkholderiales bacterium]|nr:SHOCT domain-containing protein [Burkholderiales bacterium]
MWWEGPWYGFHWMWMFPVIFLALCAAFLLLGPGRMMRAGHGRETAREILDRRYARGEISREEYQRMRKDLE